MASARAPLSSAVSPKNMQMFKSEADLLHELSIHDDLVRQCAAGQLSFDRFCERYRDFYAFYALDGHESDEEDRLLLEKHAARIEPHRIVAEEILGQVCSDADAGRETYQRAGRFGSAEAVARLKRVQL
jgi:hypothetical protein